MLSKKMSGLIKSGLAVLAGIASVLAFAPFDYYWMVFPVFACLFWLWLQADSFKLAAWFGWLFGLGQFGAGISWVYVSLNTFGNMPPALAISAVCLFVMLLALFPALTALLQHGVGSTLPTPLRLLCVMPAFWVLFEWLREWVFTGLPWLALGYSQVDNLLSATAPVAGVYGVSLLVTWISACLLLFIKQQRWLAGTVMLVIAGLCYGLNEQSWTSSYSQDLRVKQIQANISINDKWDSKKTAGIINNYLALSQKGKPSELVVWPEAAVPLFLSQLPSDFWSQLKADKQTHYLFGAVELDHQNEKLYNSVVATQDDGSLGYYRKIQLVPFGEYLPLKFIFEWVLEYLKIPMSDFSSYQDNQPPIRINGVNIGVSICYEDAFANQMRRSLPQANVLVNVSEDAWFGDSLAPHQRLQMAQMRAKEVGRSIIRTSNNGLSSIIDYRGKIQSLAVQFKQVVLDGYAPLRQGATPFVSYGHKLILSILLLLLLPAIILSLLKVRSSNP